MQFSTTQGPVPGVLCSHRKGLYPHVQLGFSPVAVVPSLSCCFELPRRACLCHLHHLSFGMCRMQLEPHFSIPHLILHIFNLLSLQFIHFPDLCVWLQTCSEGRTPLRVLLIRLMVPIWLLHRPQGPHSCACQQREERFERRWALAGIVGEIMGGITGCNKTQQAVNTYFIKMLRHLLMSLFVKFMRKNLPKYHVHCNKSQLTS